MARSTSYIAYSILTYTLPTLCNMWSGVISSPSLGFVSKKVQLKEEEVKLKEADQATTAMLSKLEVS